MNASPSFTFVGAGFDEATGGLSAMAFEGSAGARQAMPVIPRTAMIGEAPAQRARSAIALQRWIRADPPFAKSFTCSSVAIVVSPGNVVRSAPWAQPSRVACSGDSPERRP